MQSWKAEVNTAGDPPDSWSSNMLRFATKDEAIAYVKDLALRWTAVRDWRVVQCDEPITHAICQNRLVSVEQGRPEPVPVSQHKRTRAALHDDRYVDQKLSGRKDGDFE